MSQASHMPALRRSAGAMSAATLGRPTVLISGSTAKARVPGTAARIALTPASVAATAWRFTSGPRPLVQGLKWPVSPPAQARKEISFSGQSVGASPVSALQSSAKATAYSAKRAGKSGEKKSSQSGQP